MATSNFIEPIADPRATSIDPQAEEVRERIYGLRARVDPSVTFEEYIYWAKIERAEEAEANRLYVEERGPVTASTVLKGRFSRYSPRREEEEGGCRKGSPSRGCCGV
jgi:hypothetical protein